MFLSPRRGHTGTELGTSHPKQIASALVRPAKELLSRWERRRTEHLDSRLQLVSLFERRDQCSKTSTLQASDHLSGWRVQSPILEHSFTQPRNEILSPDGCALANFASP